MMRPFALALLLAAAVLCSSPTLVQGRRLLQAPAGRRLTSFNRKLMLQFTAIFTEQIGTSDEDIVVTIDYCTDFNGDGLNDIKVTLAVAKASIDASGKEDLIGVAFAFEGNSALFSSLSVTEITKTVSSIASANNVTLSTFTPVVKIAKDNVCGGGGCQDPGFNIAGGGVDAPYDIGVMFSDEGIGKEGIAQIVSFIISSNTTSLNATAVLGNTDWYVRLQSTDGGDSSAKTGGFIMESAFQECNGGGGGGDGGDEGGDLPPFPAIELKKYIKVGATWEDANTAEFNLLTKPDFKFVVNNTGNVNLAGPIILTDSVFSDADLTSVNVALNAQLPLVPNKVVELIFTPGPDFNPTDTHVNTATVNTTYTPETGSPVPLTSTDPATYFAAAPGINIVKITNGDDGLKILAGANVTWKYTVTNTGNVPLSDVTVTDSDDGVTPAYVSGDADGDGKLDTDETWIFQANGTAVVGDYSNTGTTSGKFTDSARVDKTVSDTDDSSYFGADPKINIVKITNGDDGLKILAGANVTWKYTVTNTGNVPLSDVTVTDSDAGVTPAYKSGDANSNNKLDEGETWIYEATGTAVVGAYSNTGTVTSSYTDGTGASTTPTDDDDSSYFGANPKISIDKVTDNAAVQADGLLVQQGSTVSWIYTVQNEGNVALSGITVTDDKGVVPVYSSGDANSNRILDVGETWIYTSAAVPSVVGAYTNKGTVTSAPYTDESTPANTVTPTDDDTSSYTGVKVAGARTPGFYKNWPQLWNANANDDSAFNTRVNFPSSDLLLSPYVKGATVDPVTGTNTPGVLIGDWNRNGVCDGTERCIFYTLAEANVLISADKKTQQDSRYILARSLVASWLNFLAVNPAPQTDINNGIKWLQGLTPVEGQTFGQGNLVLQAATFNVPSSSNLWSSATDTCTVGGQTLPTGEKINAALDYYNNTGKFGTQPV